MVIFGCGYLGGAVACGAVASGAKVTGLTRNPETAGRLRTEGIETVVADLAGVCADKIDLRVEGRTLVLSGERPAPSVDAAQGDMTLHHMEIDHGQFCRSVELPADVDPDNVEAFYRAGFLWIHLPKKH